MKETKEYIIQKAFVLFLQKSYKEVTMQDIVKSTGLSKGAFYHYFKSKETVFEEVIRYFYDHIMITDYNDFPTTSLKEFYQTYIRKLHTPTSLDDLDSEANLLVFIS
ncbi:MAG: TetR/AcrR family transcriptional regulator, partial [Bacteroides sp.]|nr:TetR/AcrR family transcriptional regulator [Bacteroides sp.]